MVPDSLEPSALDLWPRGLMGLVARDFLLELVDQPPERFHRHVANVLILVRIVLRLLVGFLQKAKLGSRVGECAFASQRHEMTSTMPFGDSKRSSTSPSVAAWSPGGRQPVSSNVGIIRNPRPALRTASRYPA